METPLSLVVATSDKRLLARIESLTRGSHITILGAAPFVDRAIQQIAARKPDVVVLDGQAAEADYLPFVQKLLAATPSTKCVLFGTSVDVAVMARAVAAGVQGCLPTTITYPDFIESISSIVAGTSPKAESAFTRTAQLMAIPARDGSAEASSGKVSSAMKKVASQCLTLGLTVPETARYLGMPEDEVGRCVGRGVTVGPASGFSTTHRLLHRVALILGLCIGGVVAVRWCVSPAKHVAVNGTVTFQGVPLETGEIVFEPLVGEEAQRRWCNVKGGMFALPATEGLRSGKKYSVRVRAFRDTGKRYENAGVTQSAAIVEQYLPAKWNAESQVVYEATLADPKPLELSLQ